jgi:hypothetical protein
MGCKIKLTEKNHLILDNIFKNAPKSHEESLARGRNSHIPFGKKYKEFENEEKIIYLLFEIHINKECICSTEVICLFKKYENKEITIDAIVELMK